MLAELEKMADIDVADLPAHEPHFDPVAFQESNPNLQMQDYRLGEEQLKNHGVTVTMIR